MMTSMETYLRRGRRTVQHLLLLPGVRTGAAVAAAVADGLCEKGRDITVKVRGGDLVVNYTDGKMTLTGDAKLVYEGTAEY